MNKIIQSIILQLPEDKLQKILVIRDLFLVNKTVTETIKFGRITFESNNEPIAFLCIKSKNNHIELGFFNGSKLNDSKKNIKR